MIVNRIRLLIRARIRAGTLPFEPSHETYGRKGGTGTCACCGTAIGSHEVEYEVHLSAGRKFLTHMDCYRIWREEAAQAQPAPTSPSRCGDSEVPPS